MLSADSSEPHLRLIKAQGLGQRPIKYLHLRLEFYCRRPIHAFRIMVVYYGNDTGSYAGNHPAYYNPDDRRQYVSGAMPPYYGGPYNASATSLRPDLEVRGRQHRSLPLPARRDSSRRSRRRQSPSPHPVDPVRRAQSAIKDTFTNSTSGVGVGVLGAIIGGLVAREASDAASKPPATSSSSNKTSNGKRRHHSDQRPSAEKEQTRLISTLVGAAVGGFGANALEKRIEVGRQRTAEKEEAWERKWGKDFRGRRIDKDRVVDDDDRNSDDDRGRGRHSQRRYHRDVYARGSTY